MAKHKSATQVTVVTEERSVIQRWVDQHWGKALVLGILVTAGILYSQISSKKQVTKRAEAWIPLVKAEGDLDATKAAIADIENPVVKGWGWAQAAFQAGQDENLSEATSALEELAKIDGHFLNSDVFSVPGNEGKTITETALARVKAQEIWEAAHADVLSNPDPVASAQVVVMETSEGPIEITLYQEKAPEHVANFLKLIDENYYDGILFHRTVDSPGMSIIQAGDPNSREEDTSQWGSGGPGYTQKTEKNGLIHVGGVLSAAMPPNSQESSGSQFFITLDRAHHLDGRHTIFGKVTSGLEVAQTILDAPTREVDETNTRPDTPVNPVSITTITRK